MTNGPSLRTLATQGQGHTTFPVIQMTWNWFRGMLGHEQINADISLFSGLTGLATNPSGRFLPLT